VSGLQRACEAFDRAEFTAFEGLTDGLTLDELAALLHVDRDVAGRGFLGSSRRYASWSGVASRAFSGGIRAWHEGERVLVLEGGTPVDATVPDLGEPDKVLDWILGHLPLPGGELVYAGRGLALRINPETGVVLAALAFAPTTSDEYEERLRPDVPRQHALPERGPEGSPA
jgi:hypothetical protein